MADRLEERIRSFLATHLAVIEDGLALVKEEYSLPNSIGAGGKIDILAKDSFGHWVVIEVKRSDQAARQALHEVHKYTALFRTIQGLDETRVRVILVSTEWHELLVPFSEYVATAGHSILGLFIVARSDGTVTSAKKISPVPRRANLIFSRVHSIYLFYEEANRNEAISKLVRVLEVSVIKDYVCILCDYLGEESSVILRHALYLAFVSPLPELKPEELAQVKNQIKWEEDIDLPEENLICIVNEKLSGNWDSYEIGYPEKFVTICSEWNVNVAVRGGRFVSDSSLLSDREILEMVKESGGGSPIYINKISSPRFAGNWMKLREDISPILSKNAGWLEIVPLFLSEVEIQEPAASVSVNIYSPFNFPITLFYIALEDASRCAHLEIAVDSASTKTLRVLVSVLAWDGKIVSDSPGKMIKRIYGGFSEWSLLTHFHETGEKEDRAMALHGFSTPCVELVFAHNKPPLVRELKVLDGSLARSPLEEERFHDVKEFVQENASYLNSLREYLRKRTGGI